MALNPTLARTAAKHNSAYGSVLDRFLVTHPPAVAKPSRPSRTPNPSSSSSVFEPTKSATTGCWAPPKYSLRRQAALVKEAALTGQLSSLPDGPRTARVTSRLQRLAAAHALEETASQYQFKPRTELVLSKPTRLGERAVKHSHRIPSAERQAALAAAKELVKEVGPYAGRAKVFKGSREDRGKHRRDEAVQGKLDGMKQVVRDWQEGLNEARGKAKPGLPF
ncbi:hypothetical protein PSEUBRA_001540 [Kalmanozyma brasiliensis GHG001]|uniref:Large ribosomal subunit protein mL59 domain-containing protein n=1 Tax=Kalmanozyma brasiliensis (strain GHG001) TaxID=1365824 RepID=V5F0Q8_KALBG|nr:uncharacterized protein PSEUBRA_001540 [Kalmanozyma brasiliensis GHG001]EST08834.1 hypothetical protein PSEUBRA_001540 [Kalmanozyma brasiliensis GHG001]